MKISIVTISYNQGEYLEEAIQSVISQDYHDIEYIVIDGGSTDNSTTIIDKYKDKLSYWCSEPDDGPAAALNKGFAKATGDYYFYLNSDDRLMPNAISSVVSFISKYPNYDFYYGRGFMSYDSFENRFKVYSDKFNLNSYRLKAIAIFQQSTFIKSSIFKKIKGFNEENRTHWDGELLVDLALAGATFKRHPFYTGFFRIHQDSLSGGQGDQIKYRENIARINNRIEANIKTVDYSRTYLRTVKIINDPVVFFGRLQSKIICQINKMII